MLDISDNSVNKDIYHEKYASLRSVKDSNKALNGTRIFGITLVILCGFLFLPWTQNVRAPGKLTTLYPSQRPQTVQNIIPGRIEKWYIREGQHVKKGDTILQISEIKDFYFDPQLLERTSEQISSKSSAATNYMEKSEALGQQILALNKSLANRLEQAQNTLRQSELRVISDSIDYQAAQLEFQIAEQRVKRMEELYDQGLKSLTDLETRRLRIQEMKAGMISAENKLLSARNQLEISRIELQSVQNDFTERLSKARSEKNSALSTYYDTEAQVSKLENELSNYRVRQDNYFITAAVNGYITQSISEGIGETIAQGTEIVSIMPEEYDLAVELFVAPVDFPLMRMGNPVRLMFDGWPAIVFSGWPQLSNGTFEGRIIAIDNFISPNGKYRIMVVPDEDEISWPDDLRVGTGSNGIMLMKNVPLWYEIWRQISGKRSHNRRRTASFCLASASWRQLKANRN